MRDTSPRQTRPGVRPAHTGHPVALVTGASSGIGAALAARLGERGGWELVLSGRDADRLERLARLTGAEALPADLSGPGAAVDLARRALERHGRLDALVACAGVGYRGPLAGMPAERVEELVRVNCTSVLQLVREALPPMLERGRGRIVLVSSIAGRLGVREEAVYAATKGALLAFGDSLRGELAGSGVRVCTVLPGVVDTPFFARRGTPYVRAWPRPVPAERVAAAVVRALEGGGREEVAVPGWLTVPARLHGAAPALFRTLAKHFG